MRLSSIGLSSLALSFVVLAGCSISTTDNSITIKTQKRFTRTVSRTAPVAWVNQPIVVENINGDLKVDVVASNTITVDADLVAYADDDAHQADATASLDETEGTLGIEETEGKIHVFCKKSQTHGTSGATLSACGLRVHVPASSAAAPMNIIVSAGNGQASAAGIYGTAIVHTSTGDVSLSMILGKDGSAEASTGNGTASLTLPADWAADQVLLAKSDLSEYFSDFPEITLDTKSRGAAGTGGHSVVLKSDLGDLYLRKM
jgi:hypothetical protein